MSCRLAVLFALALLMVSDSAPVFSQEPAPWVTRITAKHVASEGVGRDTGFTSLEWFLPLDQDSETEMWFGDFRGIMFDDADFGGNLGVGYRWYNSDLDRIFGVNAYWDVRHEFDLVFNQAGVGIESLGNIFDFRVNGYTPTVNDTNQRVPFRFVGHNLQNTEFNAMSGVDYEAAVNLPDFGSIQSRIAAGGYYFDSSETDAANGWRARLEVAYGNSVTAAVAVQEDDVFGRTINVTVELRRQIEHQGALARRSMHHKFRNRNGGGDGSSLLHRLADPVYRQQNIVLKDVKTLVTDSSGVPLTFLHVVEGGAGDGTFEMPFGSITDAMGDPLAPTSVVYTPYGGEFTEDVTLVPGTRLLSNGPVQTAESALGTIRLPYSGAGSDLADLPASIIGDVTLADTTEFSGFDVTGGVSGNGVTDVNVNYLAINDAPADALSFTGSDDVVIDEVAISDSAVHGILLDDSAAALSNVTITDAGDDGIQIDNAAVDRVVTIDTVAISGAANEGIDVNVAGAGDLTLDVSDGQISSTDNAFDVATTSTGDAFIGADNLVLESSAGAGFNADGSVGAGTLFINSFEDNTVNESATGGVLFDTVTFDSDPATAGNQQLASSTLSIGSATSRVVGDGLSLTDVSGDWNTGVLSIFNDTGTGLFVDNSGLGTPVVLSSESGSVLDTQTSPAVDLNTVTSAMLFDSITTIGSPGVGIDIHTVSGTFTSGATTAGGSVLSSVRYENIPLLSPLTTAFGTTSYSNGIQENGDTTGLTQN